LRFRVQREEIRDKEIGFSLQEFGLSIYNVVLGYRIKDLRFSRI
jgi:hypothetical protein